MFYATKTPHIFAFWIALHQKKRLSVYEEYSKNICTTLAKLASNAKRIFQVPRGFVLYPSNRQWYTVYVTMHLHVCIYNTEQGFLIIKTKKWETKGSCCSPDPVVTRRQTLTLLNPLLLSFCLLWEMHNIALRTQSPNIVKIKTVPLHFWWKPVLSNKLFLYN